MSEPIEKPGQTDDSEVALEAKEGARDPKDVVTRWLRELAAADQHEKDWRERAEKIVKLYRDEREKSNEKDAGGSNTRRYNILYANTEVLKGAMYSQCPSPDVRRRWLEKDAAARIAALVLNRALIASLDKMKDGEDFDSAMKDSVFDMIVPGRAVARVKYVPTINRFEQRVEVPKPARGVALPKDVQKDEQGLFRMEPVEEVVYECAETEYVEWAMFRYSPAKRWRKVRWVAFGDLLTRDDLVTQFGEEIGRAVEMKWMPKGVEDNPENAIFKRALVWTIWNKTQKKCIVICEGYKDAPLQEVDDPLRLEDFFPIPRPLYSIFSTDSLVPVPEYAIYQDHAMQLDAIEERIQVLTDALRRRGVYDSSIEELANLAAAADNKFVPVKNYREFMEKGGLDQAFQELDISGLATVIVELMKQADAKKQQIYELIGISDIMRGATKAQETLGAQKIKDNWGAVRVDPRRAEVQRFARDLIRLQAEIISEHFSAKTLASMTGVQLFETMAEKQAAAQAAAPVMGQPAPAPDPRMKRPTWEEVLKILRSDKLRGFKVDIETDSTIKPQADDEQKNRVEGLTAITGYLEKAVPAVAQGMVPKKIALELLQFGIRAFKSGPQLEELIDEWSGDAMDAGQAEENPQDQAQAAQAQEMAKQSAHADAMRAIEVETKKADMVKAKASAYAEITKAEAMIPGIQLDQLMGEANLARAQAQAESAAQPPTETLQ